MLKRCPIFFACIFLIFLHIPVVAFAGNVYDKVKESGTVRIGLLQDSAPLAFTNEKNEWVGFEVDIAEEIAKHIGKSMGKALKIARVRVDTITRIEYVKNKQVDISIASITHNVERERFVNFSDTYFFDGQSVLAKKGRYKAVKEFIDKRQSIRPNP